MTFCRRQLDRSKRAKYILQKTIRQYSVRQESQDAEDGSMDSVRRREPIICTLT
jgi:hypothetical protein